MVPFYLDFEEPIKIIDNQILQIKSDLNKNDLLEKLEKGHYQGQSNLKGLINDLPLFSNEQNSHDPAEKKVDQLNEEIKNINLDSTSPKDALEFLYKLKETLKH